MPQDRSRFHDFSILIADQKPRHVLEALRVECASVTSVINRSSVLRAGKNYGSSLYHQSSKIARVDRPQRRRAFNHQQSFDNDSED